MKLNIYLTFALLVPTVVFGETGLYCPEAPPEPGLVITEEYTQSVLAYHQKQVKEYPHLNAPLGFESDASTLNELKTILNKNKIKKNKTFIFMAANWSAKGKIMANSVFKEKEVNKALNNYEIIYIDATEYNESHREIEKHFKLVMHPIYIVFDENGNITKKAQGECFEPDAFLGWLHQ